MYESWRVATGELRKALRGPLVRHLDHAGVDVVMLNDKAIESLADIARSAVHTILAEARVMPTSPE